MIVVGLTCILVFGSAIVHRIAPRRPLLEKVLCGYLVGIGLTTVVLFMFDVFRLQFTATRLSLTLVLATLLILFPWLKTDNLRDQIKILFSRIGRLPRLKPMNLAWLLFLMLILFFLFGSMAKSLYWPTFAYDNVAGYDLLGKVMAAEGRIDSSLFDGEGKPLDGLSNRVKYPPLVSGSFAIAYLYGLQTSKIITSLYFLIFTALFYLMIRRFTDPMAAIITTFFIVITPEFFAFTSLSTTNIPTAIYLTFAFIYLYEWSLDHRSDTLILASLMLALGGWARSDSVVFIAAGFLVILYFIRPDKNWSALILYSAISISTFLAWVVYSNTIISLEQDVFITRLFWDSDRLMTILRWVRGLLFNSQQFGVTFFFFILAVVLNVRSLRSDPATIFLILTLVSWLAYTVVFYQMDVEKMGSSIAMIMKASYRRGMFVFVPLAWFYIGANAQARKMSAKLIGYMEGNGSI